MSFLPYLSAVFPGLFTVSAARSDPWGSDVVTRRGTGGQDRCTFPDRSEVTRRVGKIGVSETKRTGAQTRGKRRNEKKLAPCH